MTGVWLLLGLGVAICMAVFGFRAGKNASEKETLKRQEQENEKVEQILRRYNRIERDECLERLYNGDQK